MTGPVVSTVIPTYNRAKAVSGAIRSVLEQTYSSIEVIVVDDGSKDDTETVLRDEFGDSIRYIRQENQGVSAARNRGLSEVTGEYIAFLDSDDRWLREKIETQVRFLTDQPKYGMVVCDFTIVDDTGKVLEVIRRHKQYEDSRNVLTSLLGTPKLVPSTVLMRTEVYETIGGFDESLRTAEDIDFHLKVAARFPIGLVEEPLVTYLLSDAGLSADMSSFYDYVHVIDRFVADNGNLFSRWTGHNAIYNAHYKLARALMWEGKLLESFKVAAGCVPHLTGLEQGVRLSKLVTRLAAYTVIPWRRPKPSTGQ